MTERDLEQRRCTPCEGGTPPLPAREAQRLLAKLEGWESDGQRLGRTFDFKNWSQTIGFVNAVAWIAQREKHHPDLEVGYSRCRVNYTTHAAGGLTENDFICAAKVSALVAEDQDS